MKGTAATAKGRGTGEEDDWARLLAGEMAVTFGDGNRWGERIRSHPEKRPRGKEGDDGGEFM